MYDELAQYWHLLSPPKEYEEEAALYERALLEGVRPLGLAERLRAVCGTTAVAGQVRAHIVGCFETRPA
jgi:hypothetical protein